MSISDEEREFWDELIVNDDGTVDMDAVYNELHDYHLLAEHASRVYWELSCGRISKPNTHAADVISQVNECTESMKREDIAILLDQIKRGEMSLEEAIEEYDDDN